MISYGDREPPAKTAELPLTESTEPVNPKRHRHAAIHEREADILHANIALRAGLPVRSLDDEFLSPIEGLS